MLRLHADNGATVCRHRRPGPQILMHRLTGTSVCSEVNPPNSASAFGELPLGGCNEPARQHHRRFDHQSTATRAKEIAGPPATACVIWCRSARGSDDFDRHRSFRARKEPHHHAREGRLPKPPHRADPVRAAHHADLRGTAAVHSAQDQQVLHSRPCSPRTDSSASSSSRASRYS